MTGSMRTFVTDGLTDRQTDGAGFIGPVGGSKKSEKTSPKTDGGKYENFHDGPTD